MANLTASNNPELVLQMTAMERTTPAHYDEWNRRHQQFLDNDKFLYAQMKNIFTDNAAAHNSLYRGKDLTDVYTIDEICQRINEGTFEDLYVGDYFEKDITTEFGGVERVRFVLAGFDISYDNGMNGFPGIQHNAVVIPKDCFCTPSKMNETKTVTGAYKGTKIYKEVLPVYESALQSVLNNHIIMHYETLTDSISETEDSDFSYGKKGRTDGWVKTKIALRLMNEVQIYGYKMASSSHLDVGEACVQFPLFRLNPYMIMANLGYNGKRTRYWTSAFSYETNFVLCEEDGSRGGFSVTLGYGVRPYVCIG